jgi:hypothetical protein
MAIIDFPFPKVKAGLGNSLPNQEMKSGGNISLPPKEGER